MTNVPTILRNSIYAFFIIMLAACGGGGGSSGGGSGGGGGGGGGAGPYTISVSTTGLSGSGLQVALTSDAGVEPMSISANGTRSFATKLNAGQAYAVAVTTTPASQYCGINGSSSGLSISSNVTISVVCSSVKSLGGTVSGLVGSLKLRLNTVETLTLSTNGSYVFSTQLGTTQLYAVQVFTQPVGQLCSVSNPGGSVGSTSISNINVNCVSDTSGYQVSGYVSGLSNKNGLIILDLNGVEQVANTSTGAFTFATQLANNDTYAVTISYLSPGLACDIINNSGVINASDFPFVHVACDYIGAGSSLAPQMSSELLASGEDVVVTLNAIEDMTVLGSASTPKAFSTHIAIGSPYSVAIKTPPTGKNCNLFNAFGIIVAGSAPIVKVDCYLDSDPVYTMGGTISGLTGSGLLLSVDDAYTMAINAGATSYTTVTGFPSGQYHRVRVVTNPSGQICSVANGYRYISGSDISDANIICGPGPNNIGGYVDGLSGSGLSLILNNTEVLPIAAAGSFAFNTMFSDGMGYLVEIASQPNGQSCTITGGSGTNISASVDNVFVTCSDLSYQVRVNLAGYSSTTALGLSLNNVSSLSISANTSTSSPNPSSFADKLKDGASYEVQITSQPKGQVCTLTNPIGTINGADVTNVAAICVSDSSAIGPFTVGVTVSGLEGSGLTLQLNGASDLSVNSNGYITFASTLADTDAYTVSVATQPATPLQYCKVISGTGIIASANVSDVGIVCANGVQPLYSNGALWMAYVKNDAVDEYSASNAYCFSADAGTSAGCLHGGEYRTILLQHLSSCTGVSATDNLGLFDWTCIDNNGIRLVSSKLKIGKFMSDMMDFNAMAFKPNFVTVNDGVTIDSTSPAVWWKNKVIQNNTGALVDKDTVHLITDSVTRHYNMVEHSALVMKPGTTLSTPASGYATVSTGYIYDFLWFEGNIQGNLVANSEGINWSGGNASVISNTTVQGMANTGIYIDGIHIRLIDVNSSNNGNGIINYGGRYSTFYNLTANNNSGPSGIGVSISASGNSTLSNVVAHNNSGTGIDLPAVHDMTISNLAANNNAVGIDIYGGYPALGPVTIDGLSASGNSGDGVVAAALYNSSVSNIEAHNNGAYGASLTMYNSGSFVDSVHTTGNASDGLLIGGTFAKYTNIITANNGGSGLATSYIYQSLIQDVISNNNVAAGFKLFYIGNIIADNVVVTNNGGRGIESPGGWGGNVFMNVTSANNGGDGFLTQVPDTQFSSVLIANNGGNGFVTGIDKDYLTVDNLVSANNTGFGIDLHSDFDYFTGLLQVGSNGHPCQVDLGSGAFTNNNTGLLAGTNGGNMYNCYINGSSDATLITGIDASSTIVGKINVDDTVNTDDSLGAALFDNIGGWLSFDNIYRAWGVDGALAFADAGNQGACNTSGSSCRIWDWSISTIDHGNANTTPVAYGVLTLPNGNNTLSVNWTVTDATDQAYCDVEYPGSTWDGATTCSTIYLRHAREISGDGIGNDNALCESGETCLYTPNIGAYQGHGGLISAGAFSDGTLTGITLMKYQNLGR